MRVALPALGAIGLLLGGCSGVDHDAAFSGVRTIASERLGVQDLRWDHGTPADTATRDAVARLLESPLTADSTVQIALLNNRHLQASYEELGIAQADLVQAGLLENPSFSSDILIGNDAVSPSFRVVQNIISIVTRSSRRTVASSAFEQTKLETSQKVLDLAAEVRSAYYTVVADGQAIDLFRQVVSGSEAAAELSERQARAGNINRRDRSLQQAQYAQAVLELARVEAQAAGDREALTRLLGLSGDQVGWNIPGKLPDIPAEKPSFEELEKLAIERRLDLAGARQGFQAATYALELGRQLRFLSALGLGVSVVRDPDSGHWLKGPSIELTLPIFDQGQAKIASLESQRRREENIFVALAVDARSEVREAWMRLIAAQEAAMFYQTRMLPLQQQIVEETNRLYNGNLIGIYDLLKSRQDQIAGARDYIGAVKDYWLARSDLEKAIAGPLPGASTAAVPAHPHTFARGS